MQVSNQVIAANAGGSIRFNRGVPGSASLSFSVGLGVELFQNGVSFNCMKFLKGSVICGAASY